MTVVQYVDDAEVLISVKKCDLVHFIERMQTAFNTLCNWFCFNEMKLNTDKTQIIVLGSQAMLNHMLPITPSFQRIGLLQIWA